MYWLILSIILTVTIAVFAYGLYRRLGWEFKPRGFIIPLAVSNVLFACAAMIVVSQMAPMKRDLVERTSLVARDRNEDNDYIFVVGGVVDGKPVYSYNIRSARGDYIVQRLHVNSVAAITQDSWLKNTGEVLRYRTARDDSWKFANWALPGSFGARFEYEFEVPIGSVVVRHESQ